MTILNKLNEVTEQLLRGLQDTYQHVRHLAHGILPVVIDKEGLRAALEKLVSSISSAARCRFVWSGDVTVTDTSVASHIYRIAQEAVNNALQHGKPDRVDISLSGDEKHLVLEISDDGNGGGLLPSSGTGGKGLRTMEYRTSLIGGTLRMERSPLGGTLVRCIVPRSENTGKPAQNVSRHR